MPLRDHFRPPVSKRSSWGGFHAMWPMCIVQRFRSLFPSGFIAEPRVRLGNLVETESDGEYEYAVRVYDVERERTLVAAIELVRDRKSVV